MRTVKFHINLGYHGCDHEHTEEFEDDVTDEELDTYWQDWSNNYIDGGWSDVP